MPWWAFIPGFGDNEAPKPNPNAGPVKVTLYRHCVACGENYVIYGVDSHALRAWQNGALIREAFPDMTANEREQIISGVCSDECWNNMFPEEPEPTWDEGDEWDEDWAVEAQREAWAEAFNPIDQGMYDDDPSPYDGNYSEE